MDLKKLVANKLAERVKDAEIIGLGSGSTTELAIDAIGQRIANEGITVLGVPTSLRTAQCATKAGIQLVASDSGAKLDWAFDGADEVDPAKNLLKGRGGAMLGEKIVAKRTAELVIIVTEDKLVDSLGAKFPVPVEVVLEATSMVERELAKLGASDCVLRMAQQKYGPVVTEHGNCIIDARFEHISAELETEIKKITGVLESGLFYGYNPRVLVAAEDSEGKAEIREL